ncbi:SusC/RagA family TonB-linked outer membrane protein [Membranicola marinus]|uniref:SusC/RagA family TonB-linked outer membrane protein n=1 Tax=Membranihabitans marinus TaxID=1227546 RepID=A0A953HNY7_9BACT|nr:SusC/RagA family TonB-linked outer membrane protein [Membranihabitans marinus]MBY5959499.1 SusC/RagA family TonB-linked outer membrane protein [Membranihabitans marinus]
MKKLLLITFSLFATLPMWAQFQVSGKVTDAGGEALIGANVSLQSDPGKGTITDFDGNYTIDVPGENVTLVVSYTGYQPKTVAVEGRNEIDIVLSSGIELNELVVTALGVSRQKKSLTYSAQNVGAEELSQARSANMVNSLSGKVAGLSITPSGAGVGAGSKVLLRGNRSISGSSQPLYVVDGVVLNGGIGNLSPDDIQEMTVLKGANAAALYGSRASNGAIIVTTKSGAGASNGVTTTANLTFQGSDPIHLLKTQAEYAQGSEGNYAPAATTSWGPRMTGQQVEHWSNDPEYLQETYGGSTYALTPQPNNIKDLFQTGYEMAANLSTTIKNDNSSTFLSYTYTDARGIIPQNNLSRHNLNARFKAELVDNLELDAKVNYIRQDFSDIQAQGENFDNPLRYLYKLPPNIRTQDIEHFEFINADGQNTQHYWLPQFNGGGNPYWTINNVKNPNLSERVIGMVSLKYNLTDNLSILGRSALDRGSNFGDYSRYNDTYTTGKFGSYSKNFNYSYEWNNDVLLNFNTKLTSDISLDLNFGGNNRRAKYDALTGGGDNFQIANLFSLANTNDPRPGEGYSLKEVQSVYAFAEVGFFDGLFLDITARNDWSSTLPADNRSYFYPSFGLTAVLSDLTTMPSFIDFLKIRGSWAEVGNDTDPYELARTASINFGTIQLSSTLPAKNLKPETTRSIEFGLASRMFNNNVRLDLTYYKSNTFDQLFRTPVPPASGATSIFQNGADIQNKGIEAVIGFSPVTTGEFTWDINFNFAKNVSKVLEIAEGFDKLNLGGSFMRDYELRAGEPFGTVVSRGFQRDEQNRIIVDVNGLPKITPGKTVPVSNYNPDWLGGVRNSFTYKDFNFSFLIDMRQGGTTISFTEAIMAADGVLEYTTQGREGGIVFGQDIFSDEEVVTEDGTANTISVDPEDYYNHVGGRNTPVGEAFVRDASNVRLREMILGYSFPGNRINLSLVGRNLFFLSNKADYFDPEIMAGTSNSAEGREAFAPPTVRTFGLSLRINL